MATRSAAPPYRLLRHARAEANGAKYYIPTHARVRLAQYRFWIAVSRLLPRGRVSQARGRAYFRV